jgi:hypothetical protein
MLVCYLPIIFSYLCIPKVFKIPALSLVFWHFVCQAGFAAGLVVSHVLQVLTSVPAEFTPRSNKHLICADLQ